MLHLAILKLNFLLTFETFALIAAFFLIAYIKKQEISKWLLYGSVAIAIFIFSLMLCTGFSACYMNKCKGKENKCRFEKSYDRHSSCMKDDAMGHCRRGMMDGHSKSGMGKCMMMGKDECKSNEQCCSKMMMKEDRCSSMEKMGTSKNDSLPKKEMMKKK